MEVLKEGNYKGYRYEIVYDVDADNPRTEWSHDSVLYSNNTRINPENKDIDELMEEFKVRDLESLRDKLDKKYIWVNVYVYQHSQIALSTTPFNDPWGFDSGLLGILVWDKKDALKSFGKKRATKAFVQKIEDLLVHQVKVYGAYLNGDVYGFRLYDKDSTENEIDSCYGYYGEDGIKCIMSEIEDEVESRLTESNIDKEVEEK